MATNPPSTVDLRLSVPGSYSRSDFEVAFELSLSDDDHHYRGFNVAALTTSRQIHGEFYLVGLRPATDDWIRYYKVLQKLGMELNEKETGFDS